MITSNDTSNNTSNNADNNTDNDTGNNGSFAVKKYYQDYKEKVKEEYNNIINEYERTIEIGELVYKIADKLNDNKIKFKTYSKALNVNNTKLQYQYYNFVKCGFSRNVAHRPQLLTENESKSIEEFIKEGIKQGNCKTSEDILREINYRFNKYPSRSWLNDWLKRRNKFRFRKKRAIEDTYLENLNEENINDHFNKLYNVIKDVNQSLIINMDETMLDPESKKQKAITFKDNQDAFQITTGKSEHITLCFSVSANGDV